MMRFLPESLGGRVAAVLIGGLALLHIASTWAHENAITHQIGASVERHLLQKLGYIVSVLDKAPDDRREGLATVLSTDASRIEVSREPPAVGPLSEAEARRMGFPQDGHQHQVSVRPAGVQLQSDPQVLRASVAIGNGQWIHADLTWPELGLREDVDVIVYLTIIAALIIGLSAFSVSSLAAPLKRLATAAQRFGVDVGAPPMPVNGPVEVRRAAAAFNTMQQRIQRLVVDRTLMLAAVSHDLRTPITRMRLRCELVEDQPFFQKMIADLDEMEAMVSATLSFLHDDASPEEPDLVDIGELLNEIGEDVRELGHAIDIEPSAGVAVPGKPQALKRLLTNLMMNAVRYGRNARVDVASSTDEVEIRIEDEGPGIPQGELSRVFEPFYRVESSRNRNTGGTGLGLTVARLIARSHGGDVSLVNRHSGGLRATIRLPRTASSRVTVDDDAVIARLIG